MLINRHNLFRKKIRSAGGLLSAARKARAEVVSVDLFDTLVFRTVREPNSVFHLQHRACSGLLEGLSSSDWLRCRKSAEAALAKAAWPAEVQLAAIYDQIAGELNVSAETCRRLMDAELAVEADVIEPYRDLVQVLQELQADGVGIVVMTDTYLPASFIQALLDRFMRFEFTLLCSSETGKTKRSGSAFGHLRGLFPAKRIVHFGDNPHADVTMARRSGTKLAYQIAWRRQLELEHRSLAAYASRLGVTRLRTPWDGNTDSPIPAVEQIAWRWSFVLADFLSSVRDNANRVGATDIWFLSRDSETTFKSLRDVPEFMDGRRCQYVYGSRACVYPVIARSDAALYEKWRGKAPTEQVKQEGDVAQAYYRSLTFPDTSSILIVDIGWKGRLQILFKRIMPEHVDVRGYYFSLEPAAVPAIQKVSGTFIDWNPSVFNQAMVEALSGYVEASATRLRRDGDGFAPVFRTDPGDRSPVAYCRKLELFLTELLRGMMATPGAASGETVRLREAIVRQMSFYPDPTMVGGFDEWTIGTVIDGSDTVSIASGGRATWWQKLAGRSDGGNVWPSAAIWTLTRNAAAGRLIQHGIRSFFAIKYIIEGRSYVRSEPAGPLPRPRPAIPQTEEQLS